MADYSTIHPKCASISHALEFFLYQGYPENQDQNRPVTIIVNHGYAVGYSSDRKQPVWAAYRVSDWVRNVDYERDELFYDDPRLPATDQIGSWSFGKPYDRGHLVPNQAINTQFGRLAQMETFFMSNIAPQMSKMNRGIWVKLERRILTQYARIFKHIWVLNGPIFGNNPQYIQRPNGTQVPIPEGFFCVLVDSLRWPFEDPKNVRFLPIYIDQNQGNRQLGTNHIKSLNFIEQRTGLRLFPRLSNAERQQMKESQRFWQVSR